jgi:uncharacterized membrane protein/phage FluMu protein Com
MAIEFRCTQCGRLLRTGDDTAGRQAKCPQCGAVMAIPAASTAVPGDAPPPLAPLGGGGPVTAGPQPSQPFEPGCPFASPGPLGGVGPSRAIVPSPLEMGAVFGRTWAILKRNWGACIGVVLIVFLINMAVNTVLGLIPFLGMLIAIVFQTWLNVGQALFFLKKARGEAVDISAIFSGGPYFLRVLLASILVGLIGMGIALVCVVPPLVVGIMISPAATAVLAVAGGLVAVVLGICVGLMLSQFYYLILDRNVGVIESLKLSKKLMEGNKLALFVVGVLSALIMLAALIPCIACVLAAVGFGVSEVLGAAVLFGLLAALLGMAAQLALWPYFVLMNPVIYLTITGQPTADRTHATPT